MRHGFSCAAAKAAPADKWVPKELTRWRLVAASLFLALGTGAVSAAGTAFRTFFVSVPEVAGTVGRIFHRSDLVDPDLPCLAGGDGAQLNVVDQEGGRVRRFRQIPGKPASTSGSQSLRSLRAEADLAARVLRAHCIHINLAPVADAHASQASALRSRSYSADPAQAHRFAATFAEAMRFHGVVPTWKHFPGHSSRARTVAPNEPWARYFHNRRFEAMFDPADAATLERGMAAFAGSSPDLVMLSQAIYTALDRRPAVLIPAVAARAREVQPNALLISDDLSELRISDVDVVTVFRNVDLLLVTSSADVERFERVLRQALDSGVLSTTDLDEKWCRQRRWRNLVGLPTEGAMRPCVRGRSASGSPLRTIGAQSELPGE